MTRIETRRCPIYRSLCMGKACALTTWRLTPPITSGQTPQVTEWICDFSDRVVEKD